MYTPLILMVMASFFINCLALVCLNIKSMKSIFVAMFCVAMILGIYKCSRYPIARCGNFANHSMPAAFYREIWVPDGLFQYRWYTIMFYHHDDKTYTKLEEKYQYAFSGVWSEFLDSNDPIDKRIVERWQEDKNKDHLEYRE